MALKLKERRMSSSSAPPLRRALSLDQPWASLLVHGIKRIEGRHWGTVFRGRIWIHATTRKPDPENVTQLEALYRAIFAAEGRTELIFPSSYPQGVLVGSVEIVDCRKAYEIMTSATIPEHLKLEVGYPMCFLCERPMHLEVPIKVRGFPKFWNLPEEVVEEAKGKLRPVELVPPDFKWPSV